MWLIGLFTPAAAAQTVIQTSQFHGLLNADSGVLQSLRPACDATFDFAPSDYFHFRNHPDTKNYHTGDITARYRVQGQAEWHDIDTAAKRDAKPHSTAHTRSLLHSNFDNVFPHAAKHFRLTRDWSTEHGDVVLKATVTATASSAIEIGAFGFPLEFNNIFTNRTADNATATCVLLDPYIGLDAGYVQATRLTGTGPNLVVTPHGKHSRFEAWRFLDEDPDQATDYQSQKFEGVYAWQTLTKAYHDREWNATEPWNEPTSITLGPGQSVSFALRFALAPTIPDIEGAVASKHVPVAVGLPGYILPTDMDGRLYLHSQAAVSAITVSPAAALTLIEKPAKKPWKAYAVNPSQRAFGRVRVTIEYDDGKTQTVHYFITDTQEATAEKLAEFLFDKQWYDDASDPFRRAPSVVSYDHDSGRQVLQDQRVWIAGVSDEAGAGSFEAAAMKVAVRPKHDQVRKLEEMVNATVWGRLQDQTSDPSAHPPSYAYGVKRSLFFHEPKAVPGFTYDPDIDYTQWSAWNKTEAYAVWRAYDYVHVSVIYWALYNAERVCPGVLDVHNATWYLLQAYETVMASQADVVDYKESGLMGESVWLAILQALRAEQLTSQATKLEGAMKKRQHAWANQTWPYGSEMTWDSTGQEGVYVWSKYFHDTETARKTLNSIRAYTPTVAHWGWNGNARRYWDFVYAGKLMRVERMIHHYGSGLNSLALLDHYTCDPDPSGAAAFHDLRVGYGAHMGPLSNVHRDGFAAMAFHSFPDTLQWDAYSGDYGPNFLGHILGARAVLVEHASFGWVAFGGNIVDPAAAAAGLAVAVEPKDSVRRRLYIAAMGLRLEIDAGLIDRFTYHPAARSLTVRVARSRRRAAAPTSILTFDDTLGKGIALITPGLARTRAGFELPLPAELEFRLQ